MPPPVSPTRAARCLLKLSPLRPRLAIVLGTGFKSAARGVNLDASMAFADVPGFPGPGVAGHPGEVMIGRVDHTPVLMLNGRAHYYEGHDLTKVTFAVRTLAAYGIRAVLLTNGAGGINRKFNTGDFMVIDDHINFMGANPLRGAPAHAGERFVDMSAAYDPQLRAALTSAANRAGIAAHSGTYLAVPGPSYETPAEIRAFRTLGADAVGMSTVPETIVARQCGLRVAGLSCITNKAADAARKPVSHDEVLRVAEEVEEKSRRLLRYFVELYED